MPFLYCQHCGGRIGAYEPMIWVKPDGSTVDTGYTQIRSDPESAHVDSRFFHGRCAEAADFESE